jgi:uncharacterized membrane protein YvbJ
MRFCRHCGNEILEDAVICLRCGCRTQSVNTLSRSDSELQHSNDLEEAECQFAESAKICGIISLFIGWFVLGITAIILAFMSKREMDGKMRSPAKVGFICGLISTSVSLVVFAVGIYAIVELGKNLF